MRKYSIEKHKQLSELLNKSVYILWLETENKNRCGCYQVYQGSYKECLEYRKDMILCEKNIK